jgi:hypothetical protein
MKRRIKDIIDFFRYDLPLGLENLRVYGPIIWRNREWDYVFLLRLMELKFRRMSAALENGYHLHNDRYARQLRVCAELCKRMLDDNYYDKVSGGTRIESWTTPGKISGTRQFHMQEYDKEGNIVPLKQTSLWFRMADRNKANDLAYMTKLMGKYLFHWWD